MASTVTHDAEDACADERPDAPERAEGWRSRLRRTRGVGTCFRCGVFAGGLVLVLVGVAMWMFTILLTLPLAFAGVWLWSTEFGWGRRLHAALTRRARRVWAGVRARPVRAVVLTALGWAACTGAYWAATHGSEVSRAARAVGL